VTYRVLIVDDEELVRVGLIEALSAEGFVCDGAAYGDEALGKIKDIGFDLVLLDMRLPGNLQGLDLLRQIKAWNPDTIVIMMTAFASVGSAVEAMKLGAYDYVTKPFKLDEIRLTVRRALDALSLRRELARFKNIQKARYNFDALRSPSPKMQAVYDMARKIARSKAATVLILGESGTGKELVARAIHYESDRADKPFMEINCTAVPETLLESELFGYEKGAFTDAKEAKEGLFELADGGTIFLDEIGDMSPAIQAKLLRFLQERTFKRVGGVRDIKVDVRIIAATNRDLEKAVKEGSFRADLYYRINVVTMELPPLRERAEDIIHLANKFVQEYNLEFGKNVQGFTPEAEQLLLSYPWPGNVRELKNMIERVMLLENDTLIRAEHLPIKPDALASAGVGGMSLEVPSLRLEEVERAAIQRALEQTGGNKAEAAKILGINRTTLYSKLRKLGMEFEVYKK